MEEITWCSWQKMRNFIPGYKQIVESDWKITTCLQVTFYTIFFEDKRADEKTHRDFYLYDDGCKA